MSLFRVSMLWHPLCHRLETSSFVYDRTEHKSTRPSNTPFATLWGHLPLPRCMLSRMVPNKQRICLNTKTKQSHALTASSPHHAFARAPLLPAAMRFCAPLAASAAPSASPCAAATSAARAGVFSRNSAGTAQGSAASSTDPDFACGTAPACYAARELFLGLHVGLPKPNEGPICQRRGKPM